jgi:hypothetical protein
MDISTLIAGPIGGVLGLAGALTQKWMAIKESRESHAQKMAELQLASTIDVQKAGLTLRQTTEEQAGAAFSKAIDAQSGLKGSSPIAQDILALFRPGLTLLLWLSSLILSFMFRDSNPEMLEFIVTSTFTMFTVSTGYWFGVRTEDKFKRTSK